MEMTEEVKAGVEEARKKVDAMLSPYGFKVAQILDEQLPLEVGEAWFILASTRETDKPPQDFFEACYYLRDSKYGPKKGVVSFGIQAADWIPLHNEPATACDEFRAYNGD